MFWDKFKDWLPKAKLKLKKTTEKWDKFKDWLPKVKLKLKKTTEEIEEKLRTNPGITIPVSLEQRLRTKIDSLPIHYSQIQPLCDRTCHDISSWLENSELSNNSLMVLGDVSENLNIIIENTINDNKVQQHLNNLQIEVLTLKFEKEDYHKNIEYFHHIIDQLKLDNEQKVVVIPNLSNYFIRTVEGLQLIEYFFEICLEDKNKFWVIGCHHWLHLFLEKIYKINGYFRETITIPELSIDDFQNIFNPVLDTIDFEWSKSSIFKIELPDDYNDDQQELEYKNNEVKDDYYSQLTELSKGKLQIAIALFFDSLRYILPEEDQDNQAATIKIFMPEFPSLPAISQNERYLIYCVGLHKYITKTDLITILAEDKSKINNQINKLLQIGIIYYKNNLISLNYRHYFKLQKNLSDNKFPV